MNRVRLKINAKTQRGQGAEKKQTHFHHEEHEDLNERIELNFFSSCFSCPSWLKFPLRDESSEPIAAQGILWHFFSLWWKGLP